MGEHKRQGKTFFVTYSYLPRHIQYGIHRAPSGHFSIIKYVNGVQQGKSQRITQRNAALKMGISIVELLELFNRD